MNGMTEYQRFNVTQTPVVSTDKNRGQDFDIIIIDLTHMNRLGFLLSGSCFTTLISRSQTRMYIFGNYMTIYKAIKHPQNTPVAKAYSVYQNLQLVAVTIAFIAEEALHRGLYLTGTVVPIATELEGDPALETENVEPT